MVRIHEHDVIEFSDGPVRTKFFTIDKMNRVFFAQALKVGSVLLLLEK